MTNKPVRQIRVKYEPGTFGCESKGFSTRDVKSVINFVEELINEEKTKIIIEYVEFYVDPWRGDVFETTELVKYELTPEGITIKLRYIDYELLLKLIEKAVKDWLEI